MSFALINHNEKSVCEGVNRFEHQFIGKLGDSILPGDKKLKKSVNVNLFSAHFIPKPST